MKISEVIGSDPKIESITSKDIPIIRDMAINQFENNLVTSEILHTLNTDVDWSISKKLVVDDKIIGFFLFNEKNINDIVPPEYALEDLSKYNRPGIEGIMLMVLPEYRGRGLGNCLKDLASTFRGKYDYVFGQQLKNLNNLNDWLKRRRLVGELPDFGGIYVTLADLK